MNCENSTKLEPTCLPKILWNVSLFLIYILSASFYGGLLYFTFHDYLKSIGVVIDHASSVIAWLIIIAFFNFVRRMVSGGAVPIYGRFARGFIIFVMLTGGLKTLSHEFTKPRSKPLSGDEMVEVKRIILEANQTKNQEDILNLRKKLHELFRNHHLGREELQSNRKLIEKVFESGYLKIFYRVALNALRTGKVDKTKELIDTEKGLISSGFMTVERLERNDILLKNIAAKNPVDTQGERTVITEEYIQYALENLNHLDQTIHFLCDDYEP